MFPMKQLNILVDEALHRQAKSKAYAEGLTLSAWVTRLIADAVYTPEADERKLVPIEEA